MESGLDFGGGVNSFDNSYINETSLRKIKKAVGTVKAQEGEGDVNVNVSKQRKLIKANHFCLVFYENIGRLLADGELNITKNDMRVLFKLLEYTSLGNLLSFSQTQIAKELDLTRQVVNRSLSNLKKKGVIMETARGLFFNPLVISKGNFEHVPSEVMLQAKEDNRQGYLFPWDDKTKT